jgi:glycerate-2-kinase
VRGRGGRNQQLVLAAMTKLGARQHEAAVLSRRPFIIFSAGTDGEDGPTDAAGAYCDAESLARAAELKIDLASELKHNNAYAVFEQLGSLIKTGPTHTNVCDLRVVIVDRD